MKPVKVVFTCFIYFTSALFCFGQSKTGNQIRPLKIGDAVPDMVFSNMVNNPDNVAKLSDFEGKAVLLDFWATWCIPCIASFPKLEELQRKYRNDLKIILLSSDDEARVRDFYRQRDDFLLPTSVFEESKENWYDYFPQKSIPHYIWINKHHKITAITGPLEVNEGNLQDFIDEKPMNLPRKMDFEDKRQQTNVIDSIEVIGGRIKRISLDSNIIFESKFRKHDARLTQTRMINYSMDNKNKYIQQVNCSILHLYRTAYFGIRNGKETNFNDCIVLNRPDRDLDYPKSDSQSVIDLWSKNNSYSYYLITSKNVDSAYLFDRMQKDLTDFFGIRAKFGKKKVDAIVLMKIPGVEHRPLQTEGGKPLLKSSVYSLVIKNKPISALFAALSTFGVNKAENDSQSSEVFINETGIKENIDLDLRSNLTDFTDINKGLSYYGLILKKMTKKSSALILYN